MRIHVKRYAEQFRAHKTFKSGIEDSGGIWRKKQRKFGLKKVWNIGLKSVLKKCEILALIEGQFNAKKKISLASERRENLCQICVKSVLNLVEEIGAKTKNLRKLEDSRASWQEVVT